MSLALFGGLVVADAPFPGLPVAPQADGLSVVCAVTTTTESPPRPGERLGQHTYGSGVELTLDAVPAEGGWALTISDTGCWVIAADGRAVRHHAPPSLDRSAAALDLIGAVLPIAFFRQGRWCLHASAVATPAGAVVLLAERGVGKSTLAAACGAAGAAVIADDVVVLDPRPDGVWVQPSGVPVRLRAESARALGTPVTTDAADDWGKVRMHLALQREPLPLAAIHLLVPVAADGVLSRTPLGARTTAMAMLAHGKVASLLGGAAAPEAFLRATQLAERVTAHDLHVPRSLDRLGAVAQELLAWHAAPVPSTVRP